MDFKKPLENKKQEAAAQLYNVTRQIHTCHNSDIEYARWWAVYHPGEVEMMFNAVLASYSNWFQTK
jgi:hypothetical protein